MAIDNIPIEISENTQEVVLDIDDTSHPYYVGARAYVTQIAEGAIVTVIDKFGRTEATLLDGNYGNITDISYDPDTKTLKKVNGMVIDDVVTLSDVAISNDYEDLDNLPDIEQTITDWLDENPITKEELDEDLQEYLRYKDDYPLFGGSRNATGTGNYSAPNLSAGINGDATAKTLATYYNRDAVVYANVAQNNVSGYDVAGKQYAILSCDSTSVTLDNMDDYPKSGMVVHLFETVSNDITDGYVGVVDAVVGNKVTVLEWYEMGDDANPVTPTNVNYAVVNIITRLYNALVQAVDGANAPAWYRSSIGISTEVWNRNPNSKASYGNIVYIRSAKGENVNAFIANNSSGDTADTAFGAVGSFSDVLSLNGTSIIDGDGVYVGENAVKKTLVTKTTNANGNIATGIRNILSCIPSSGDYIILPYSASGNIRVFTNTMQIVASTEITMTIYHL